MALASAASVFVAGSLALSGTAAQAAPRAPEMEHSNIFNTNSQRCLGTTTKNVAVLQNCTDSQNPKSKQTWHVGADNPTNHFYAHLVNGQGLCLGVRNQSKSNAAVVIVSKCGGPGNRSQYWAYDTTWQACGCGYGAVFINWGTPAKGTGAGTPKGTPGTGGKGLGIVNNSTKNGAAVILQTNRAGAPPPFFKGQAWDFASGGT
jgi:hypothetical protein